MTKREKSQAPEPFRDVSSAPRSQQLHFQATMGDTSATAASLRPLEQPGEIVWRIGRQFQLPRSQPDAEMGNRGYGGISAPGEV